MARLASFLLLCTLNASCDFDTFSEPSDEHNVRVAQSIIDPIGPHANASDFRDVKGLGHWHLDAVLQPTSVMTAAAMTPSLKMQRPYSFSTTTA
jgi:hypothetical protein